MQLLHNVYSYIRLKNTYWINIKMTINALDDKLTTISKDAQILTLINVATVEPENQQRLVEMFEIVTENVMSKQPGFISANIHKSLDGEKVVTYAQWRSDRRLSSGF